MRFKEWNELVKVHPKLKTLKESKVWSSPEIGKGWYDLIDELMCELEEKDLLWENFKVMQVKEKFGMLRFYYEGAKYGTFDVVMEYEAKSGKVCEECGKLGKPSSNGWIKTLCEKCRGKRNEKYNNL